MTRIGFVCLPYFSHVQSMLCLALELQERGHDVVMFGIPDALAFLDNINIPKHVFAEQHRPLGSAASNQKELSALTGIRGLKYTIRLIAEDTEIFYQFATPVLRDAAIDFLILDQAHFGCSSVAEYINVPFITFANALLLLSDPYVPHVLTPRVCSNSALSRARNRLENLFVRFITRHLTRIIIRQRTEWNLPSSLRGIQLEHALLSPLAVLSPCTLKIEFPRANNPDQVHYIGRWTMPYGDDPLANNVDFPFEELDDQRHLVYASLGTVQTRQQYLLHAIASACSSLPVQLVLSLGDSHATIPDDLPLSDGTIVVPFAPQAKLVPRAAAIITHAGLNTALMAIAHGKPMLAIPITNDQPGVAGRMERAGVAVVVPPSKANERTLQRALTSVLQDVRYRECAEKLAQDISAAGGVSKAADIVERIIETRMPVLRHEV